MQLEEIIRKIISALLAKPYLALVLLILFIAALYLIYRLLHRPAPVKFGVPISIDHSKKQPCETVFTTLKDTMDGNDILYVWTFNHGTGYNDPTHELDAPRASVEYDGDTNRDEGNELQESSISWPVNYVYQLGVWYNCGNVTNDGTVDYAMLVSHWTTDGGWNSPYTSDSNHEIEWVFDFGDAPDGADGNIDWCQDDTSAFNPFDADRDNNNNDTLCDVDGDNHADIDLNFGSDSNNWVSDGEDVNDDFEFYGVNEYLDLNQNNVNDWIGIDEGLVLWNNEIIYDDEFEDLIDAITFKRVIVVMQQCHGGGFIADLSGTERIIVTACEDTMRASRGDTEYETYGGERYHHGEFNYYFMSAFYGEKPDGTPVNADSNSDKVISIKEAFDYVVANENRDETPQSYGGTLLDTTYL